MIGIVWGSRPEVIKLFPVVNTLKKQKIPFYIINSHQHYDQSMIDIFYKVFGLNPETFHGHDEISGDYTKLVVSRLYLSFKERVS